MPYLTKPLRAEIDDQGGLDQLKSYLASLEEHLFIGALNYTVFAIVRRRFLTAGKSYFLIAAIVGTLFCCVLEIYRRIGAPYEDEKIADPRNGDVD